MERERENSEGWRGDGVGRQREGDGRVCDGFAVLCFPCVIRVLRRFGLALTARGRRRTGAPLAAELQGAASLRG
eukprot:3937305-Rhodomonas_salina.5